MDECFVIQPFDDDKYDRRFNDIFEPAIKASASPSRKQSATSPGAPFIAAFCDEWAFAPANRLPIK
jgi:hypothetical protein